MLTISWKIPIWIRDNGYKGATTTTKQMISRDSNNLCNDNAGSTTHEWRRARDASSHSVADKAIRCRYCHRHLGCYRPTISHSAGTERHAIKRESQGEAHASSTFQNFSHVCKCSYKSSALWAPWRNVKWSIARDEITWAWTTVWHCAPSTMLCMMGAL